MFRFEVGKFYEAGDCGYDPIQILRRTAKMVTVTNGTTVWSMRIREDKDGNEFVTDCSVPMKWRDAFTYMAKYEAK